jgi:hypothetical protein
MSLKRNILANYASQTYVTLIGILMLPVYLRYMGAEAYGRVGFSTMPNALFQLLDMGLSRHWLGKLRAIGPASWTQLHCADCCAPSKVSFSLSRSWPLLPSCFCRTGSPVTGFPSSNSTLGSAD